MFSFSRALHLMFYGGKKVRRTGWADSDRYLYFDGNDIKLGYGDNRPVNIEVIATEHIVAKDWEICE